MTSAVERFQALLRIPTVSSDDPSTVDWAAFESFIATIAEFYPRVHAALPLERVAGHSLLFHWKGTGSAAPTVLMAHYDVVPVIDSEWARPPFGAEIHGEGVDATIHGRGTLDDKGSVVAILEAAEAALAAGFTPAADIYLSFGHNEEVAGDGARAIAELLRTRGIRPALVLDEGGAVVEGVFPGVDAPAAVIGVAERGIVTLELIASEAGGHASTPPRMPATARLARAITRLQARPFRPRLAPPVRAFVMRMGSNARQPYRWLFTNLRLTGGLVAFAFSRLGPETNAIVRTTAVATRLSGSPAANVLATTAKASVNIRILTGDSVDGVVRHVRRAVADSAIDIEVHEPSEPSPVSPWTGAAWRRLETAIGDALGRDIIVTPYVQLGASDSRWFTVISDHVYRFTPFSMTGAERETVHAANERVRVDVWLRGIETYRRLIELS